MTVRDISFTRPSTAQLVQKSALSPFAKLQPFSEALPQRLLLLQQISSKRPALVAAFIDPAESAGSGLSQRSIPSCSACFIRSRSGVYQPLIENPRPAHSW
jgi:hypothetical protein